jgi:hypothetical protein
LNDEIEHNGIGGTINWVWKSIGQLTGRKVKHPKPLDVALNNYHTYSAHKGFTGRPSSSRRQQQQQQRRREQKRPPRLQEQRQQQQEKKQQQKQTRLRQKQRPFETTDDYHSAYSNSYDY